VVPTAKGIVDDGLQPLDEVIERGSTEETM